MDSNPVPPEEEKKGEESVEPQEKHVELKQTDAGKVTEITILKKGNNESSPFISQAQDWDNENLNVPEKFRVNL